MAGPLTLAQTPAARPDPRARARDLAPVVTLPLPDLEAMLEAAAERGAGRALEAVGAVTEPEGLSRIGEPQRRVKAVDAKAVAEAIGWTPQTVRAHWRELGGWRLGSGPKAPIRFDLEAILSGTVGRSSLRSVGRDPSPEAKSEPSPRRAVRRLPRTGDGLPNETPVGRILASRPRRAVS